MHSMGEYPRHVPAMSGLSLPVVPVSRSVFRQRVAAAACAGTSAFLVVLGSFLPLFSGDLSAGGLSLGITVTSWGFEASGGEQFGAVPVSGYVLVAAAVLLLGATFTCVAAAMPTASRGMPRAAGLTAMAAAAFLTGTVWLIGMEVASFDESFRPIGISEDDATVDSGTGIGLWLLVVATVLALTAVVVALLSTRERTSYAAQLQADLTTPRHGFLMPVDRPYPAQHPYPAPPQPPASPWAQQSVYQSAQQPPAGPSAQPAREPNAQQSAYQSAQQPPAEPSAQPAREPNAQQSIQPPVAPRAHQSASQTTQPAPEPNRQQSAHSSAQPASEPGAQQSVQPPYQPAQGEQPAPIDNPPDLPAPQNPENPKNP